MHFEFLQDYGFTGLGASAAGIYGLGITDSGLESFGTRPNAGFQDNLGFGVGEPKSLSLNDCAQGLEGSRNAQ